MDDILRKKGDRFTELEQMDNFIRKIRRYVMYFIYMQHNLCTNIYIYVYIYVYPQGREDISIPSGFI